MHFGESFRVAKCQAIRIYTHKYMYTYLSIYTYVRVCVHVFVGLSGSVDALEVLKSLPTPQFTTGI